MRFVTPVIVLFGAFAINSIAQQPPQQPPPQPPSGDRPREAGQPPAREERADRQGPGERRPDGPNDSPRPRGDQRGEGRKFGPDGGPGAGPDGPPGWARERRGPDMADRGFGPDRPAFGRGQGRRFGPPMMGFGRRFAMVMAYRRHQFAMRHRGEGWGAERFMPEGRGPMFGQHRGPDFGPRGGQRQGPDGQGMRRGPQEFQRGPGGDGGGFEPRGEGNRRGREEFYGRAGPGPDGPDRFDNAPNRPRSEMNQLPPRGDGPDFRRGERQQFSERPDMGPGMGGQPPDRPRDDRPRRRGPRPGGNPAAE